MKRKALGLIETYGYIGAIEAADVCLKAANVRLISCEKVRGGLVTIEIRGNVAAVKAAIDAAKSAVENVSELISTHVIPRPASDVEKIITDFREEENKLEKVVDNKVISEESLKGKEEVEELNEDSKNKATREESLEENKNRQELEEMKVIELRSLARTLNNIEMTNKEIKFGRKKELIEAILDVYKKGGADR